MSDHGRSAASTARLHLDRELLSGQIGEAAATAPAVLRPLGVGRPTARPIRMAQRARMKFWPGGGIDAMVGPGMAARHAALGTDADGPPRILIRVDEFPCATSPPEQALFGTESNRRFHQLLTQAGISYLMAVVPQPARDHLDAVGTESRALDPGELELLQEMKADGVQFAQHGRTHRTRHPAPTRRSELCGLTAGDLGELVDDGRRILEAGGMQPRAFAPPFNRFDSRQWPTLSARYRVIAGGPESVALVGAQPGPRWIGDAVYIPSYAPLYGTAGAIMPGAKRLIELAPGSWVPITLHNAWEIADNFEALKQLVDVVAPYVEPWEAFFDAVDRSSAPAPS